MHTSQHTLFTTRLCLEPARQSDFWSVWDIWSTPDIAGRVFGDQPADSLEAALSAFDRWTAGPSEGLGAWIVRSPVGQTLGCASLHRRPRPTDRAHAMPVDFHMALKPMARGKGLAREASRALLRNAFNRAGLYFIQAQSKLDDLGVNHFLAGLGFQVTGEYVDEVPVRLSHLLTRDHFQQALSCSMPLA